MVVSDNGCGLPEADLSRAVARFWRGHDDRPSGTGLGLGDSREIAAGHGGGIAVEKAPEGGLLVRYGLPQASEKDMKNNTTGRNESSHFHPRDSGLGHR